MVEVTAGGRANMRGGTPRRQPFDGSAMPSNDDARAALVDDRLSWRPTLDVPALEIDVRVFFADVADPPL
jgi:hypothetical protein